MDDRDAESEWLVIGEEAVRHHELIRVEALRLAIESHGAAPGKDSDRCFTARAAHFLDFILRFSEDRIESGQDTTDE